MEFIPSPYYFVPLAEQVFLPAWGNQVSQDVPFKEGLSGWLDLTVTAKTPLYIRNGGDHKKRDRSSLLRDEQYCDFFRVTDDGSYAIPGTSLKGVIRNVLEIATFSRMSRVADLRYAVRDLNNPELYTRWMTTGKELSVSAPVGPAVRAGWLESERGVDGNKRWFLMPCEFARVERDTIANFLNVRGLGDRNHADRRYGLLGNKSLKVFLKKPVATKHGPFVYPLVEFSDLSINAREGYLEGSLVLTGQPMDDPSTKDREMGKRHTPQRKHLEFIFHSNRKEKRQEVPRKIMEEFEFIHSEGDGRPNREWRFWLRQHEELGARIPVFYLAFKGEPKPHQGSDVYGDEGVNLHSIGLAMMYRLPYKHSIHSAIKAARPAHLPDGAKAHQPDFAECLFGFVHGKFCLRGRVQFETLLCQDPQKQFDSADVIAAEALGVAGGGPVATEPLPKVETVLNGPKPTFYPNYVQQDPDREGKVVKYHTLMDDKPVLSGWKRYPVRKDGHVPNPPSSPEKKDVATAFNPLPAGVQFKGRVHFHNLRPEELGALVWALEWGGNKDLRHAVGMAKPYGYGSVSIAINKEASRVLDNRMEVTWDKVGWQNRFVMAMESFLPGWEQSPPLVELKAMANSQPRVPDDHLRYPSLEHKEFQTAKGNKLCLPRYSQLSGYSPAGSSRPPAKPAAAPQQGSPPAKVLKKAAVYNEGEEVIAEVRVSKKGNVSFQIKDAESDCLGKLAGGAKPPSPVVANSVVKLRITALPQPGYPGREQFSFEWIELVSNPSSAGPQGA